MRDQKASFFKLKSHCIVLSDKVLGCCLSLENSLKTFVRYPGCQRFVLRGFRSRSMSLLWPSPLVSRPRPTSAGLRQASHEAGREKPLAPRVFVRLTPHLSQISTTLTSVTGRQLPTINTDCCLTIVWHHIFATLWFLRIWNSHISRHFIFSILRKF